MYKEGYDDPVFKTKDLLEFLKLTEDSTTDLNQHRDTIDEIGRSIKLLVGQNYGPFISGYGGEDEHGYPTHIHVCYHLGADRTAVYTKKETRG